MILLVLVLVVLVSAVVAQDLQYHCITCDDQLDRCELDCAWSKQDMAVGDVTDCQQLCADTRQTCTDSPAATKCTACALTCAQSYDTDMRRCLASVSRLAKATYGSSLSECEVLAAYDMDSCMKHCSPDTDTTDDYVDDNATAVQ